MFKLVISSSVYFVCNVPGGVPFKLNLHPSENLNVMCQYVLNYVLVLTDIPVAQFIISIQTLGTFKM